MKAASTSNNTLGEKIVYTQSLRFRLLAYALIIALIPTILMMTITVLQSRGTFEETSKSDLLITSKAQGQLLSKWFQEQLNFVNYLAQLPEMQSLKSESYIPIITSAQKEMLVFNYFYLMGPDGMQLYKSDNSPLVNLGDRDYFKRAMQGESLIADPVVSKATGKLLIPVVAPVKDSSGKVIAVLAGSLSLDSVSALLKEMQFDNTGEAILFNEKGYFLTASRFDEQLKQVGKIKERSELELQNQSDELQKAINGEASAITYTSYMDTEAIGAFAPVQAANIKWAVEIKQDNSEVYSHLNQLTNQLIILLIVVTIIVIVLTVSYTQNLVRALHIIVQAGSLLSVGDANLTGMRMEDRKRMRERKDEIGAIARSFTRMIGYQKEAAEVAQKIAAGDLTVEVTAKSESDLIGNALQRMVSNLNAQVGKVAENAHKLKDASDQLAESADQAGRATNQISTTIQQVAKGIQDQTQGVTRTASSVEQMSKAIDGVARGAQEQSRAINKVSEITTRMSQAIQQVSGNAHAVTSDSSRASEAALNGSKTVEETLQGMQSIKTKVGLSAQKVQEMGQRSNQIGTIVETIDDIASQTNLLALNAAIEAARAGEHGKGFAVVADEVRKLAERSSSATKEIGKLVAGIQSTVNEAVKAMDEGSKQVEVGVTSANQAGKALTAIIDAAEAVNKQAQLAAQASQEMAVASGEMISAVDSVSAVVEENTAATEQMAAGSNEVSTAIESIASVSEENSAAVEEVSASTEEMSAQVEEVTASALTLAEMAEALEAVVSQFKLA